MRITPFQPIKRVHQASSAPAPMAPAEAQDTFTPAQVALFPSQFVDPDPEPFDLPKDPPPQLKRPIVFVHGFNGNPHRWDKVGEWLASTGENRWGGVVEAGKFENLDPTSNMFALAFSRSFNSVETNKDELKAAVEAVCAATGASEVDLVVHSLGGLDARYYLQDPDEKVAHVVQMGTPNHGSYLANLELVFREKFGFPISPPTDDPEVRRTLHWLTLDTVDKDGTPANPELHALNQNWGLQRERAQFLMFTGNGYPTATGGLGVTIKGDSVVARRSAELPGADARHIWFKSHGKIQNSAKVVETMANFLTDKPLGESAELFDTPEQQAKAEELGYLRA
ncbi:MAG: esterase/lipase family protein [Vulcanimicrobiota bacterium]